MSITEDHNWFPSQMLEVSLREPDDFLKIRETLTRIGIASKKDRTLYQSCHILHKQGKYYIVHFKELFILDGKDATIADNDIERRNAITRLLEEWDLLKIIDRSKLTTEEVDRSLMNQIKIVPFREKSEWTLESKYSIGGRKSGLV